ncbi:WxL domain-containing protein [Candidatus Enterococcus murrayae]|uniref:WxL domain-containing protein n=1 Tax=Candidatus Enterococcus murrayae TaxID=2815321 RepID=A0ABS3HIE4_9ENTE|nr:WxL domain-containing protein [Enterococcus sp. MJM16]MBO0452684.1 WxL domain-containing protein [Enterococcus sp. MJM16]
MKKKLFAGMLASATVLGMFVAGGTVLATEVDTVDTEVGIGFSDHIPGTKPGPLKIQWAPISLDFKNDNQVNTATHNFAEKSGKNRYVVISDERTTATPGDNVWKLTAALSDLENATATEQLTGATLKFNAALQGFQGTDAPEAPGSVVAPGARTADIGVAAKSIAAGAPATQMMEDGTTGTADAFQGKSAMEMTGINLEVPASAAKEGVQYKGTLTWSLDDTI